MNVAVLVPRRSDGGRRDVVWAWVLRRWEDEHPEWPVFVGQHIDGPFNRSLAINRASRDAGDWDVAIVADSDSFVAVDQLRAAVDLAAKTGQITFAYDQFRYLSRRMSDKVMGGYVGDWYKGVEWTMTNTCSSMVVVPRALWDEVGGFDEGFVGWGFEDVAFSLASQALGGGMQRTPGDVWHLHHPSSTENNHNSPLWQASLARMHLYRDVDYDRRKMEVLLAELRHER